MSRRLLLPLLLLVACGDDATETSADSTLDAIDDTGSDTGLTDGSGSGSDTAPDGSADGSGSAAEGCTPAPVEQLARIERAGLSVSFAGDGSWSLARGAELVTTGVATCDDAAPGARVAAGRLTVVMSTPDPLRGSWQSVSVARGRRGRRRREGCG